MRSTYLTGFILGLICSFGQPPFNYVFPSLCSIALFLLILDNIKVTKQAILYSFFFGYGYFIYSHHWLIESFLAYGNQFLWLIPIAILVIPAAFAPYFALMGFLIHKYAKQNIIVIAFFWLFTEYLRSYGYIESPWLLIGYVWSDSEIVSQSVSAFGIWGLSFLTIIWAASIYSLVLSFNHPKHFTSVILAIISFIGCYTYGEIHLSSPLTTQKERVRVIQPNIDNNVFSRINKRYENLDKIIELSKEAKFKNIHFIVWPEGAHEFNGDKSFFEMVAKIIPPRAKLILNASRVQQIPEKHWNSMFVINHTGEVVDYYDKSHLVAFGEYIPLRYFIPFIQKITPGAIDYERGNLLTSMHVKPPFMPSICYEDAFPEFTTSNFTWIVNITNDGWFGTSIGPYQHLSIAKFRAIEHGVPMIRAALTGISAIIDAHGRIIKHIPLMTEGVIDTVIPPYITHFTYFHTLSLYSLILLIVTMIVLEKFLSKRLKNYSSIF